MYIAEGFRKTEGEGVAARLANDFVGTKILFGEFLGRTGSAEELGLDVDRMTDLEMRWRNPAVVTSLLVALLSPTDVFLEVLMEFP